MGPPPAPQSQPQQQPCRADRASSTRDPSAQFPTIQDLYGLIESMTAENRRSFDLLNTKLDQMAADIAYIRGRMNDTTPNN